VDAAASQEPPAYVYAAGDIRPRQPREIELCAKASSFDWLYTGTFATGVGVGIWVNTQILKQNGEPGLRLLGPAGIGFAWGGLLSGGYLSLPKCDPLFAYGAPPEGDIRSQVPLAAAISLLATITAPAMDFIFLGAEKPEWHDWERSSRVFVAMGTGLAGSLFPYLVPPKTWAAKKEIERIRLGEVAGGPFVSYAVSF
jgi:hypothetical protein